MKVLLVTFDIDLTPMKYLELCKTLQKAKTWWHYLQNTWLIWTKESPEYWFEKIAPIISKTDKLLIIEVKDNYTGWLTKAAWDWISAAFKSK